MLQIRKLTCPGILSSVDLTAGPAEFVGLAGANGSGKTTLLKCIAGIIRDVTGEILVREQRTAHMAQRELARTVSYVPQIVETRIPYTVMDFMMLSRFPQFGLSRKDPPVKPLEDILKELHVHHLKDRITGSLSGGELQKILIAAALAQDTPIVMLDEPASHLDPLRSAELVRLLKSLRDRRDRLYLMVSHQADHLAEACDRIICLKDGQILGEFPPALAHDRDWQAHVYGQGKEPA